MCHVQVEVDGFGQQGELGLLHRQERAFEGHVAEPVREGHEQLQKGGRLGHQHAAAELQGDEPDLQGAGRP